jgi:hypothetical protein
MTITTFKDVPDIQTNGISGPIEQRFEAFHKLNPHVYALIVDIAVDLKNRGFKKCGMKLIFERLRWLYAIQTQGGQYKLNNDYTAYYARLVMHREKALDGFFRLREQRADQYDPSKTP